jgi:hypothetical protein
VGKLIDSLPEETKEAAIDYLKRWIAQKKFDGVPRDQAEAALGMMEGFFGEGCPVCCGLKQDENGDFIYPELSYETRMCYSHYKPKSEEEEKEIKEYLEKHEYYPPEQKEIDEEWSELAGQLWDSITPRNYDEENHHEH